MASQEQQPTTVEITWEPGTDLITLTTGPMEPVAVPTSANNDPGPESIMHSTTEQEHQYALPAQSATANPPQEQKREGMTPIEEAVNNLDLPRQEDPGTRNGSMEPVRPEINLPRKCQDCGREGADESSKTGEIVLTSTSCGFRCKFCIEASTSNDISIKDEDNALEVYTVGEPEVGYISCKYCQKDFDSEASLQAHECEEHTPSSFHCSYCSGVFKLKSELDLHEKCTHAKGTVHRCKHCRKSFVKKSRFNQHMQKHRRKMARKKLKAAAKEQDGELGQSKNTDGNEEFADPNAGQNHSDDESMDIMEPVDPHELEKRAVWGKEMVCQKCGKKFKIQRLFDRHVESKCNTKDFRCEGCHEVFPARKELIEHEAKFKGEYHYSCRFCGKRFIRKQGMHAHERIHEEDKPYKCQFCQKGFLALNKCKIHERSHTGEKPFSCKLCGKEYATKESCTVHERKHQNDFKYLCKYCGKGFIKKYSHRTHELNHEGYRPFACSVCGKTFARKSDLQRHEFCQHSTNEKDAYVFLCQHCGRGFKLKGDLKLHERIHTGEKPYDCPHCKRSFARAAYFNRHMRLHHNQPQAVKEEVVIDAGISAMETLVTIATGEEVL